LPKASIKYYTASIITASNIVKAAQPEMVMKKGNRRMEVQIENRQGKHKISKKKIQQKARAILDALDYPDAELSILIVDDQQIARLNQQYLNRKGPTNVIAFAMQEGPFTEIAPDLLGDVVISVETAHREAETAGLDWATYFDQLLIHGILHLLGYDHENDPSEARKMEQKAMEILEFIKLRPAP
jgi:probable rRNA maturation factor